MSADATIEQGSTEAEALVATLEAAPARGDS
jgi:hypothetical protein